MSEMFNYYVPVKFLQSKKPYYFGLYDDALEVNSQVVVETTRGLEIGEVIGPPVLIDGTRFDAPLKPIIRVADEFDLATQAENSRLAADAREICENLIAKLNLDMNLISAEYTLDRSKILFVYISEVRVDFRELLKELAAALKCRIELRQVGPRDKAKIVGGIGTCGMETCCSKFKEEFGVISINMAKNQMMALNVQKLSGQCGKLMCCLAYENELYSILKVETPKINSQIHFQGKRYKVTNINVLTQEARLENKNEILILPFETAFEDYRNQKNEKTK